MSKTVDIDRLNRKIAILQQFIENKKVALIVKGDQDYPDGVEFPLSEEQIKVIKKAIKELKRKLRIVTEEFEKED